MFSATALEQGVRRPSLLLYLPCQPVPARGYLSVDKSVDNLGSHRQGNVHPTSDSHIVLGLTSEVFPPLVATATCTGTPKETPAHVARFLPGYCRPQVVAAEAGGLILPENDADSRSVIWAKDRNAWVAANPEVEPRLAEVPERKVRAL